jgi:hypothetical protein
MAILPFIQERLSVVGKEIKADLFHWLSGKKNPNLAFSGSLVDIYWGPYIEENISKIINIAFTANRELSSEHDIDPINSINDSAQASKNAISEVLNVMADYDQKMRGNGYPNRVPKKDITKIKEKYFRMVDDRANNERTLLSLPKKNTIKLPLTSEHGFYWFIKTCHWSTYPFLLGLVAAIFFAGFKAGRNDTLRKVYDAFTNNSNTLEISQPQNPPIKPAAVPQKTANTKQETTNIQK